MDKEAAVLAWLSGNNELSWKAINEAAGRKEQARLNVGKDYSTEEVKIRDYAAKKRDGGETLRNAAHKIWQNLTKNTGDKNITTRDVEGALLNAIRENPTRIDAAKNLISIAGAEEAPISIEEGVEDFYKRKGEQPAEPVVEQGMPEGGFVPFQEGEEEIPFSVQELPTDEVNDMKEIHEAGHIWTEWVKQFDNKVYQRGIELVKNSEYLKEVKSSKFYQEQAKKLATKQEAELYFQHEALAMAIGDKGAQFVTESKRTSFKEWLDALWTKIRDLAGFKDITAEELQNITFEEFTKMAVKDILGKQFEGRTLQEIYETLPMGKKLRQNKQEILIRDNFDNIVAELIKNNKIEKIC